MNSEQRLQKLELAVTALQILALDFAEFMHRTSPQEFDMLLRWRRLSAQGSRMRTVEFHPRYAEALPLVLELLERAGKHNPPPGPIDP